MKFVKSPSNKGQKKSKLRKEKKKKTKTASKPQTLKPFMKVYPYSKFLLFCYFYYFFEFRERGDNKMSQNF